MPSPYLAEFRARDVALSCTSGPDAFGGVGHVAVTSTLTSISFKVDSKRYFDGKGSTNKFRTSTKNKSVYLDVSATASRPNLASRVAFQSGYIQANWSNLRAIGSRANLGLIGETGEAGNLESVRRNR